MGNSKHGRHATTLRLLADTQSTNDRLTVEFSARLWERMIAPMLVEAADMLDKFPAIPEPAVKYASFMTEKEVEVYENYKVKPFEDYFGLAKYGEALSREYDKLASASVTPEPCICPPGAISRKCMAVGWRTGIMHKDRE